MVISSNLRALIVAGGGEIAPDRLAALAASAGFIVAADSGFLQLRKSGIKPDTIIGDLDSLSADEVKGVPPGVIRRDTGQDDTDLEKAIRFCLEQGIRAADIVGATGNRLDHTLNAVSLLLRYSDRLALTLHDDNGWATLATQSPLTLSEKIGERVSLSPALEVYGLRSKGLRFPLENLDLCGGSRDAVSNEVASLPVEITWSRGAFLLYRQMV
jgi:thiamine pyrophosphokinase